MKKIWTLSTRKLHGRLTIITARIFWSLSGNFLLHFFFDGHQLVDGVCGSDDGQEAVIVEHGILTLKSLQGRSEHTFFCKLGWSANNSLKKNPIIFLGCNWFWKWFEQNEWAQFNVLHLPNYFLKKLLITQVGEDKIQE